MIVGRYAPSPSGRMHVGNLFSYLVSYLLTHQRAKTHNVEASMRLRVEDLDPARSKKCYIDQLFADLAWFGFSWDGEVVYQSKRTSAYQTAFSSLLKAERVYPCFCSRADLHSAQAPHRGEEILYAGTCRPSKDHCKDHSDLRILDATTHSTTSTRRSPAYRLLIPSSLSINFKDYFQGEQVFMLEAPGDDFIVRRSDGVFAYQLAVVLDDAFQGVNCIVRGEDLLTSTAKQIHLRSLLRPFEDDELLYAHVPLIVDESGKRLSKRNQDATLSYLIETLCLTASEILGLISFVTGLIEVYKPLTLHQLVEYANLGSLRNKTEIVWPSSLQSIL